MGTPFTGIVNPLGGATTDALQAIEELGDSGSILRSMALAFGFNLQDVSPATRR
jgi:hypothetical protein